MKTKSIHVLKLDVACCSSKPAQVFISLLQLSFCSKHLAQSLRLSEYIFQTDAGFPLDSRLIKHTQQCVDSTIQPVPMSSDVGTDPSSLKLQ